MAFSFIRLILGFTKKSNSWYNKYNFKEVIRLKVLMKEDYLRFEGMFLSEYAQKTVDTRGRLRPEIECPMRTEYQRDRDRILHSKSFRRLKHKTQVFLAPSGDHYRTRMTHTLEVMQIARTLARALRLNEDLTEAIAFGHDLGHTPFGHIGERVLNELSGRFEHNEQSLRVADVLENEGQGLNLTYEVRDGILQHRSDGVPCTLEGKIVSYADRIAYLNHDIDDAIRAGLMCENDIPKEIEKVLGIGKRAKINNLVNDIVVESKDRPYIKQSWEFKEAMGELRKFMFKNVYFSDQASIEEVKAKEWLIKLYNFLKMNPEEVPEFYRKLSMVPHQYLLDYIAGMTDTYVIKLLEKYFDYKWDSIL